MKLLCVGHAIKEVLTAGECLDALLKGAGRAGVAVAGQFLVSDGGDGFLEAYEGVRPCTRHKVSSTGPLGDVIEADFVLDDERKVAIIESAQIIGLHLIEPQRRNIMISGTAGLADMIAAARDLGAESILIGLGGTATCDGGIGLLWRLAELTGKCTQCNNEYRVALDMAELSSPDLESIRDWLGGIRITAAVDVNNPLLGPRGAAHIFAPQKGANPDEAEQLEGFMHEWAQRIERSTGTALAELPGAGAAGGLGFALAALGATLEPGGSAFCRLSGLAEKLDTSALVVTAEGKFDLTSLGGKAPWSVANMARENDAKAVIFCGVAEPEAVEAARSQGVTIVEFGKMIPPEQRKTLTADKLAAAVADFLQSVKSPSV